MSSIGRGRGWSQNQENNLRRPGGPIPGTSNTVKDITDKINAYDIREHISPQLIQEIVDLLTSTVNKNSLKNTCDTLLKQAVLNNSLATRTAVIFSNNKVALIEDNNKDVLRSRFLCFLQDNYMSREKDRVEDRKRFANVVLLHAEVYYRMRLSDGSRVQILAEPLIHYMEDLLHDNSKDNIYFIMIQILRSGKDLCAACPEQLEGLITIIRQLLIKENVYNPQTRAILLLTIELANNNYEIENVQLKQFYVSNIKSLSFEYPFSQEELKVTTEMKIENDNKLREVDTNQRFIKNDVSEQGDYSRSPNIPRAIRGSGARDKIKKGDDINTKINLLKISPRQKSNKGWDHDDRFHKDYE